MPNKIYLTNNNSAFIYNHLGIVASGQNLNKELGVSQLGNIDTFTPVCNLPLESGENILQLFQISAYKMGIFTSNNRLIYFNGLSRQKHRVILPNLLLEEYIEGIAFSGFLVIRTSNSRLFIHRFNLSDSSTDIECELYWMGRLPLGEAILKAEPNNMRELFVLTSRGRLLYQPNIELSSAAQELRAPNGQKIINFKTNEKQIFVQTEDKRWFAKGEMNMVNQLGVAIAYKPVKEFLPLVTPHPEYLDQIVDIIPNKYYTLAVLSSHQLLIAGRFTVPGVNDQEPSIGFTRFHQSIDLLPGESLEQVLSYNESVLTMTSKNRLFVYGKNNSGQLGSAGNFIHSIQDIEYPGLQQVISSDHIWIITPEIDMRRAPCSRINKIFRSAPSLRSL